MIRDLTSSPAAMFLLGVAAMAVATLLAMRVHRRLRRDVQPCASLDCARTRAELRGELRWTRDWLKHEVAPRLMERICELSNLVDGPREKRRRES